jgi:hypothetical protein
MASWTGSAAVAAPQRRPVAQPRPKRAPRPTAQPTPRRRPVARGRALTGGIVWIVLLAVLLAGVVALNVAVLRLNMNVDRLDQQRTDLRAQNQALASRLSAATAAGRTEVRALRRGLVQAAAENTTYVELTRSRR